MLRPGPALLRSIAPPRGRPGEGLRARRRSILVGYPGDEYLCTHDHGAWRRKTVLQWAPALVETIGGRNENLRSGGLQPERGRRGAVDAALWIDAQPQEPIDLETAANEVRTKLERSPESDVEGDIGDRARVVDEQRRGRGVGRRLGSSGRGGARGHGRPGLRSDYSPTDDAAFLFDPVGNNVEAVCMARA